VLGDCDRADLEKALAQAKKENAALLKKLKRAVKENKVLAAERETLSGAVGDKGLTKGVQLMSRLIESAPRKTASKQGQYEKGSKCLQRNATHREKVIGKLQGRLQITISELEKLRDRKDKTLRKLQKTMARGLLLRNQRASRTTVTRE
jgi:regulator of replication initiation timing